MKKRLSIFCMGLIALSALLFSTRSFAQESPAAAEYAPPVLEQEGGWTMVVIPDPQQYTSTRNIPLLEMMMNWIVEQREPLNIMNVVCVGDLVNNNGDPAQWNFISGAFARLDGKVAYVPCTGNHDYGKAPPTADTRDSNLSRHFTPERNSAWQNVLVEMGENAFGEKTLENAAFVQTAPNGQKVVILCLQFAPTDKNLEWAKAFAAREEYKDAFVAVVTHLYMLPVKRDNKLDGGRGYQLLKEGNNGEDIWKKLVEPSSNIRLVLCGHHSGKDEPRDCTGFRVDKNAAGKSVYQMIYDTQALGGGFGGNGGDGWLRLLEFSADMKHVKVKTFSPFFAISPTTRGMAVDRADYNCFEFDID